MQKRGQISYFILLGIILLIGAILFIYLWQEHTGVEMPDFTTDMSPIERNIYQCYYDIARDGLEIMGRQGGYINMERPLFNDVESYQDLDAYKIAKWYYRGQDHIPTVDMEKSILIDYVKAHAPECINNLNTLSYFTIEERDKLDLDVVFNQDYVQLDIHHPLSVFQSDTDEVKRIDGMVVVLDVEFGRIMALAKDALYFENREKYIEDMLIDHISMDSDIPLTGMEFDCDSRVWYISDIRERVRNLLLHSIPNIQFLNTQHYPLLEDESVYESIRHYDADDMLVGNYPSSVPADAFNYFQYYRSTSDNDFDSLRLGVRYRPDWPIYIYSRPSTNGQMKSNVGKSYEKYLSFICLNIWHFTYDINFDVHFMISDPDAFKGEGYTYTYSVPIYIDHNEPNRNFKSSFFLESAEYNDDFCFNNPGDEIELRATGLENGMKGMDLQNITLTYFCLKYKCKLGKTKAGYSGYGLTTRLPGNCANGYLEATGEGYLDSRVQLTEDEYFEIPMKKINVLEYKIIKHPSTDKSASYPIAEHEVATVHLEAKNASHTASAFYNISSNNTIEIIADDNEYDVNIIVMDPVDERITAGYSGTWKYSISESAYAGSVTFNVYEKVPQPFTVTEQYEFVRELYDNNETKTGLEPILS
ncbi:hypothetical protein K9M79_01055 [Candidatus Woesearchaeota archaeon]|nr:hypothetical protein [Candidatus Woesearchaeota archaeon]